MSPVPEPKPTTHKDRWWIVAAIAAVLVTAEVWLAKSYPESSWPWLILLAMGVFVAVMFINPHRRFRRWASHCLIAAMGVGAFPSIAVKLHWNDQKWIDVNIDETPMLAALCMLGFIVCAVLDFLNGKRKPSSVNTSPTPLRSQ